MDQDQLRAQVIEMTLKSKAKAPSSYETEAVVESESRDVNSSELASSIKQSGDSLLEQVIKKKSEQPKDNRDAIRKQVIESSSMSMLDGLMGKLL